MAHTENVKLVLAYSHTDEVKALFTEYTDLLIAGDHTFREYLQIQNYDDELTHLERKYGLPHGRLYLAYFDNKPAGCIGLRKIDHLHCEMKRLYIRPGFRRKHIGSTLVQKIITDAKEIGYSYLLLDTLPFLKEAIALYQKIGFYEIPCYNNSPMTDSIYMKLDLQ